jgi:small subunit ribosomal protein S16
MVKIRLTRLGKHKMPYYRMVAIDSRIKRDGGYLALIGTIEPRKKIQKINKTLLLKFLNDGAVASNTVVNILKQQGI